ncbi:hypothetical protein Tco_0660816, partial [Tanacetum coccineum]
QIKELAFVWRSWRISKLELLWCQMFSKLMTADLEAVVKQRHQNPTSSFCFGQSPLEVVEEDFNRHDVSSKTWLLFHGTPLCCHDP